MSTNISHPHLVKMDLKIGVEYPAHAPRTESPEYKAARNHLVNELDLPCLVCGVKQSTLSDPVENKYDAKMMETHHHNLEWALINAVDVSKFNKVILPHLKMKHPERVDYQTDFTQQQMEDWVDHDPHNLWVLCDFHHTDRKHGIHYLPLSIWQAQDLMKEGFALLP